MRVEEIRRESALAAARLSSELEICKIQGHGQARVQQEVTDWLRKDLLELFKIQGHEYMRVKSILRPYLTRKTLKHAWYKKRRLGAEHEKSLCQMFEIARRRFYDDVNPLYRVVYEYTDAKMIIAIIGYCVVELKRLVESEDVVSEENIAKACELLVDPSAYISIYHM
jgi:hypothetical protein